MPEKCHQKQSKNGVFEGLHPPKPSVCGGLHLTHRPLGAPPPDPGGFWIESPYLTGYQISLVSVSESGLQKYQNLKRNILFNEKIYKIGKLFSHTFLNIAHLLGQKIVAVFVEEGGGWGGGFDGWWVYMLVTRTGPQN